MDITINGRIPSLKNSKIMVCRGKGRPMMFPSKKHQQWHKDASKQITGNLFGMNGCGYKVKFVYFTPDERKTDLSNKWESVADLLVDCGVIEDDNCKILSEVHLVWGGLDRDNPRAEINIEKI